MKPTAPDDALTVSDLTWAIRELLQVGFPAVWVRGEISGFLRAGSGHGYWTLKDDGAQIKAVCWRNALSKVPFELRDGLEVLVEGSIDVYAQRGQHQLVVRQVVPQGVGPLELAFRQLCEKLKAEGLFEAERKKPVPRYPRRVGIVTSPDAAALRDFLEVSGRRWPAARRILFPTPVQGQDAPPRICERLRTADAGGLDVIALIRGGGSLEDLWAFNDEGVARAVAACRTPVVSGVGHEIDLTVADLVADLRALTPSEAAERIFPDADAHRTNLRETGQSLLQGVRRSLTQQRQRIDAVATAASLLRPLRRLAESAQRLDDAESRLLRGVRSSITAAADRLDAHGRSLDALSPLRVLDRGFALVRKDGVAVTAADRLAVGDRLDVRLARGRVAAEVTRIEDADEE